MDLKAWDTRHKKIFDVEAVHIDQVDYVDDVKTEFDRYLPKYGYPSRDEVILLRSAERNDLNGIPIYEFYIVQSGRHREWGTIPEYVTSRVEFHPSCGFQLNKNAQLWNDEWVHRVVGNKFENPELWEKAER